MGFDTLIRRGGAVLGTAIAALGLAVVGTAPAAAVTPAPATTAPAPIASGDRNPGAIGDFGACLKGGGEGDLLLLVDESSSLLGSDPGQARVTSATYFVNQLSSYTASGGSVLNLQLGVFAHGASTIMPWTPLNESSVPGVRDQIATLKDRVEGFDTDYWTALDWAQREFSQKAQQTPGTHRCQAIVMFTDGKLDFSPRTTSQEQQAYGTEKPFAPGVQLTSQAAADQVREAAKQDICRQGGVADQLASSDIKTFGIGLSATPGGGGEFDLFQAIVEGKGGAETCGTVNTNDRGQFFGAGDIDGLLLAFDAISSPDGNPIEIVGGVCQKAPCSSEAHEFVLDTSTPDVRILAQADVANLDVSILMPNGTLVQFPKSAPGQSQNLTKDGATFSYAWETDKTISITATQAEAQANVWQGLWQLAFTDPSGQSAGQQSRSNVHIRGSLLPSIGGADAIQLRTGGTVPLQFSITDRRKGEIDPTTIPGTMGYRAVLVDGAGTEIPLFETTDKKGLRDEVKADLTSAAVGTGELRLTLDITTASAKRQDGTTAPGTTLEPEVVAIPVTILPPADFPTLGQSLDFGLAEGKADLTAVLPVTGEGCVWIEPGAATTVVASPEGIGATTITAGDHTAAGSCYRAGSGDGVTLRLTTAEAGNGTINGTVPVTIGSKDGNAEPITVQVPFTANLAKPLNTVNFLLVLIAAPLLGIGVPLALLYLAKWVISKIPSRPLVGAVIPITVQHGQVLRDGRPFELGPQDLTGTVPIPPGGGRTARVGDVTLRAKTGATPTGAGYVTVDAPHRHSASSKLPSTDKTGLHARLPLAVHNTWVVLHADGAPGDIAQVLVLIGGDATPASRTELERDIARRLPGTLEKLVRAGGGTPAGELQPAGVGSSPFGGSGGIGGPGGRPGTAGSPGGQGASPFGGGSPFQGGGSPWGTN